MANGFLWLVFGNTKDRVGDVGQQEGFEEKKEEPFPSSLSFSFLPSSSISILTNCTRRFLPVSPRGLDLLG